MDSRKRTSSIAGEKTSTTALQRLKERARSVDRYLSQQRFVVQGSPRGTSVARPEGSLPPTFAQQTRKSRPPAPRNGDLRQASQRFRSPSINGRLQQNLQNLVSYLFERKNDAKKRQLAERLLWTALRRNEVDLLRDIVDQLQDPPIDINLKNEFGWNLVDEAVMLGFTNMAVQLFSRGGKESPELRSKTQKQDALKRALRGLEAIQAASRLRENASARLLAADVASGPMLAVLQQMSQYVERTRPPRNYLDQVTVQAWGDTSVAVHFSSRTAPPGVISRFKVEWCKDRHFENAVDYEIFQDLMNPDQLVVGGLTCGQAYFVRLSVGNLAGFGMPVLGQPSPLLITSWREVDQRNELPMGDFSAEMKQILQNAESIEQVVKTQSDRSNSSRNVQRRSSLKDSFKSIMKAQSRTASLQDGGLFLGCLIATEDSVLLMTDFTLPVHLIQSPFLGSLSAKQYLWLQKVCSVPSLAIPLRELLHSSRDCSSDIRYSIIQALINLQTILELDNLGAPYFHAIHDDQMNLSLLLLVKKICPSDQYRIPFAVRWVHIKEVELMSIGPCHQMLSLLSSIGIADILSYDRAVQTVIPTGLHLGFVQLQPSLDNVSVIVSKNHPNTLPSIKIRSNPHVNRNEWDCLLGQPRFPTEKQLASEFLDQIQSSWMKLKNNLSLKSVQEAYLYQTIVQLGPQRAMIVLYSDTRDLAARQPLDDELRRGSLSMAVQTLESIYFETHQKELWNIYCQSSLLLDALNVCLHQHQREIFRRDDGDIKRKLSQVQSLQDRLERLWTKCRWLPDVVRTVTSRSARPLPLPFCNSGLADDSRKQSSFQERMKILKANGQQNNLTKKNDSAKVKSDQISVTVVIQNISKLAFTKEETHKEISNFIPNCEKSLVVTIDDTTTAEDIVRQVLLRSVGHLAGKLVPFYALEMLVEDTIVLFNAEDIVRHFYEEDSDAQFNVIHRPNKQ